jgi:hypothetical protein
MRKLVLALTGLFGFVVLPMTGVAGAATTGISTTFAGAATTATFSTDPDGAIFGEQWRFTAVAVGTSPLLATLSVSYSPSSEFVPYPTASFTLNDLRGDVVQGQAQCPTCAQTGLDGLTGTAALTGTVTSSTGSYAGLKGHPVVFNFSLAMGLLPLQPPGSNFSPALFLGTLTVS